VTLIGNEAAQGLTFNNLAGSRRTNGTERFGQTAMPFKRASTSTASMASMLQQNGTGRVFKLVCICFPIFSFTRWRALQRGTPPPQNI